jgi:CheY-like chemotaxis protein
MDHMMPGMDGIEAVRIIRNEIDSGYARSVPVIALTANALIGIKEMFLSKGFNGYISKPIDIVQLDSVLNVWVRGRQSAEAQAEAEKERAVREDRMDQGKTGSLEGCIIDGVDLIQGRERYNSVSAYLDILHSYVAHTPPVLEKLKRPSPEPLSEYTVKILGLKGSSYGICANGAGKKAGELEAAARAGDIEKVMAESGPFIETVKLLLARLEELLKSAAARRETAKQAPAPDSELLARLLDAAKRYKTAAMEEILEELESYEYEQGGELVVWLRTQMADLEYDQIRTRLEAL